MTWHRLFTKISSACVPHSKGERVQPFTPYAEQLICAYICDRIGLVDWPLGRQTSHDKIVCLAPTADDVMAADEAGIPPSRAVDSEIARPATAMLGTLPPVVHHRGCNEDEWGAAVAKMQEHRIAAKMALSQAENYLVGKTYSTLPDDTRDGTSDGASDGSDAGNGANGDGEAPTTQGAQDEVSASPQTESPSPSGTTGRGSPSTVPARIPPLPVRRGSRRSCKTRSTVDYNNADADEEEEDDEDEEDSDSASGDEGEPVSLAKALAELRPAQQATRPEPLPVPAAAATFNVSAFIASKIAANKSSERPRGQGHTSPRHASPKARRPGGTVVSMLVSAMSAAIRPGGSSNKGGDGGGTGSRAPRRFDSPTPVSVPALQPVTGPTTRSTSRKQRSRSNTPRGSRKSRQPSFGLSRGPHPPQNEKSSWAKNRPIGRGKTADF